ncbi:uncharacterized protein V1518DRAFT_334347 [Limtongia smithiae]|uniref:uncharacterized protein n=1 Tax=Limtongia smithiae TaxID=1125753 RepID=UPI0034CD7817
MRIRCCTWKTSRTTHRPLHTPDIMSTQSKKRANLAVPYVPLVMRPRDDITGFVATGLPMIAMFLKIKIVGWASLLITLQSWLNETADSTGDGQPAWFKVIMSLAGLFVCYMDLLFPGKSLASMITSSAAPSGAVTTRLTMAPRATIA